MDNFTPLLKVCRICKLEKPATLDYFYREPYKGGLRHECKKCATANIDIEKRRAAYSRKAKITPPVGILQKCSVCASEKTADCFTPAKAMPNGISKVCKECRCAAIRERTAARSQSPEVVAARAARAEEQRVAREAREQLRQAKRQHRQAFLESRRVGAIDRKRALDRRLYTQTREARMAYVKDWCKKNPEKARSYNHTNRSKRIAAEGTFTAADVAAKLQAQENKCYWCGKKLVLSGPNKFQIDHHHPLARGGSNWPSNIVCACRPCNNSKSARTPWDFNGRLL